MARRTTRTKPKSTPRPRGRAPRAVSRRPSGMDLAAMEYAKLLVDPCGAKLVRPLYGASASGYLARFQRTFTLTQGFTGPQTVIFCPGLISDNATGVITGTSQNVGAVTSIELTDAVTETFKNYRDNQPGIAFFASTNPNITVRPVAACLRARYTGTELNRGGAVYTGFLPTVETAIPIIPSATGAVNGATAAFANVCQFSSRTPDGSVEVRWAPNRGDQRFRDVDNLYSVQNDNTSSHAACFASFSGLPAGTSVEYTVTAVYEWVPNSTSGLVIPTELTSSRNTLDSVLGYLRGFGNWYTSGEASARFAREATMRMAGRYIMGSSGFAGGSNRPRIEL